MMMCRMHIIEAPRDTVKFHMYRLTNIYTYSLKQIKPEHSMITNKAIMYSLSMHKLSSHFDIIKANLKIHF